MSEIDMLRREFADVMRSINASRQTAQLKPVNAIPPEQFEFAKAIAPAVIAAHAEHSVPTRFTDEDIAESIATITENVFKLLGQQKSV